MFSRYLMNFLHRQLYFYFFTRHYLWTVWIKVYLSCDTCSLQIQAFFLSLSCYLCKCHKVIKDSLKVHCLWSSVTKVIQKHCHVVLVPLIWWLRCVDIKQQCCNEVSRHIGQRKLPALNSVKWEKVHSWCYTTKSIGI